MYGTIARLSLKRGTESRLQDVMKEYNEAKIPGFIAGYIYKLDKEPDIFYMIAVFENKALYDANAKSPEQDARYRKLAVLLDGDPEWNDGEIVFALAPQVVPLRA